MKGIENSLGVFGCMEDRGRQNECLHVRDDSYCKMRESSSRLLLVEASLYH